VNSTRSVRDRPPAAGRRLRVRVAPGAPRAEIVGRLGDVWKLRVRSAPERGRANDEVVGLLADALRLTPDDVRVVAGRTSRDKLVELDGLTLDEAERRLASGRQGA
jgi:uncharacterized protein (TIGR00251 family)